MIEIYYLLLKPLLLLLLTVMHLSVISAKNSTLTAYVNTTVTLPCRPSINDDVDWRYQSQPMSHIDNIYTNGIVYDTYRQQLRFKVNRNQSTGVYDLVLSNAQQSDSGLYICVEEKGIGVAHYIHLTVTDPPPPLPTILIVVIVLCAIVVVAIIICLIIFLRKRNKSGIFGSYSVPLKKCRELTCVLVKPHKVYLHWPASKLMHPFTYTVQYRRADQTVDNNDNRSAWNEISDLTCCKCILRGLEEFTVYEVGVLIRDAAGGPLVEHEQSIRSQTSGHIPREAPANVSARLNNMNGIVITWDRPDTGFIQGYKVFWSSDSGKRSERSTLIVNEGQQTELRVTEFHSKYTLQVAAFNPAGDGPGSSPVQVSVFQRSYIPEVKANYPRLVGMVDVDSVELLVGLLVKGVINHEELERVRAGKTADVRSGVLLDYLAEKSVDHCDEFLKMLEQTSQIHVVNFIRENGNICREFGDVWPLDGPYRLAVDCNHPRLVEVLETDNALLSQLMANGCIGKGQMEYILKHDPGFVGSRNMGINEKLLDALKRRSCADINKFLEIIGSSRQRYLLPLFSDEVVIMVSSRLDASCGNVANIENQIVSAFQDRRSPSGELAFDEGSEVASCLSELGCHLQLIDMRRDGNIRVYVICRNMAGLQHYVQLCGHGRLQKILEKVFAHLSGRQIAIRESRWTTDYSRCVCFFTELQAVMQRNAYQVLDYCPMDRLSDALLLKTLVRAAVGLLTVHFGKISSHPDVRTLNVLSAVSNSWRQLVITQKNVFRDAMDNAFRPYGRHPQLNSRLMATSVSVCGVAILNDKMYVISDTSDTVTVFRRPKGRPTYEPDRSIVVSGMKNPLDIVACPEDDVLYIADSLIPCIWKLKKGKATKWKSLNYSPQSLSIYGHVLLAIEWNKLHRYGRDGAELKQIELPYFMKAEHAVQTPRDTFIACYTGGEPFRCISELDGNGNVIRGPCRFDQPAWPCYLALDSDGHVIAADRSRGHILLLKPTIELERVLLSKNEDRLGLPVRMCYSPATGSLVVAELENAKGSISDYWIKFLKIETLDDVSW